MRTLTEIMNENRSDKGTFMEGSVAHGYAPLYESWFGPIRKEPLRVVEIGVCDARMPGASLRGWHEFFPNAMIFGFDIVDAYRFENSRTRIFRGDQSSRADLERFVDFSGGDFDIVIDDGSHIDSHQQVTLSALFPHVKPRGQYFIEDLQVSPNSVDMLCRMQRGLPGDPALRKTLLGHLKTWSRAVRPGRRLRPYISTSEIAAITEELASLDMVCNNKLARLVRAR